MHLHEASYGNSIVAATANSRILLQHYVTGVSLRNGVRSSAGVGALPLTICTNIACPSQRPYQCLNLVY